MKVGRLREVGKTMIVAVFLTSCGTEEPEILRSRPSLDLRKSDRGTYKKGRSDNLPQPTTTDTTTSPTPTTDTPDTWEMPAPAPGPAPAPRAASLFVTVDATQNGSAISSYIYGSNMVFESNWDGTTLRLPFGRVGGNQFTPYNWEINGSNSGVDGGNQNSNWLGGGDEVGGAVRKRVDAIHGAGATALVTVSMADYSAADKIGGADVNQTANYLTTRFRRDYFRKGSALSLNPDKNDNAVYQDEFANWVVNRFDRSRIFFSLDNEPDLWDTSHPRIRSTKLTFEELRKRTIETATRLKEVAPQNLTFGPALSGYGGFMDLGRAPDYNNRFFVDYYLQEMRKAEQAGGKRLLDVLDLHWYSEHRGANNIRVLDQDNTYQTVVARMQAPRSLWDPTFTEKSWITDAFTKGPIRLIPLMRDKINTFYPGTKLALTEYYYGGGNHITGAVAQADALGIFGREGLFAANWWPWHFNEDVRYIQGAFRSFLNYDGAGGKFGDLTIPATTSDAAQLSAFASKFSDQTDRRVLVLVNKSETTQTTAIQLKDGKALTSARTYVISGSNANPVAGPMIKAATDGKFYYDMPAVSVTTILITP